MKIVVCVKYVRDEADIKINPDRSLNLDTAPWIVSPYDLNAVEAAMRLAEAGEDSTVEAITLGCEEIENAKNQKALLSRGPAKLYAVKKDDLDSDNYQIAQLLGRALETIDDIDLIICGEGSGDMYSQVLGNMLGAALELPTINSVSSLNFEDGTLIAERNALYAERYAITSPAVVSVTSDICNPRIPSMRDILAAGKKPVEPIDVASFNVTRSPIITESILAPEQTERKQTVLSNSPEDIESFAKLLRKSL